jgi:lysophospholipase L1-like esterase
MRRALRVIASFICIVCIMSFSLPPKKIRVYLIGDSTIADKHPTKFPETGWGTPFKIFFDSTVVIENRAKNGRSTKTFISENLWQPIVDGLQEGDYVFIQFGHNDEVKEKTDRYTTPDEYQRNLVRFIRETRSKHATPVLLTPVTRRKFKDGVIQETHEEYSKLVAQVAAAEKVAFIDLDSKSRALLQEAGEEASKLFFLQLKPGEHPNYPEGKNDNTHFSETGARKMAQIVLADIVALRLELADRIVKPTAK